MKLNKRYLNGGGVGDPPQGTITSQQVLERLAQLQNPDPQSQLQYPDPQFRLTSGDAPFRTIKQEKDRMAAEGTDEAMSELIRMFPVLGEAIDLVELGKVNLTGRDLYGEETDKDLYNTFAAAGLVIPNVLERPLKFLLRKGARKVPFDEAVKVAGSPISRVSTSVGRQGDLPVYRKTDGNFAPVYDEIESTGRLFDKMKVGIDPDVNYSIENLGIVGGRPIVRIRAEDGTSQLFYKSTGLGGKSIDGKSTQGMWQPFGGITDASSRGMSDQWFIKGSQGSGRKHGFEDYYGSESFKALSDQIDYEFALAAQQKKANGGKVVRYKR